MTHRYPALFTVLACCMASTAPARADAPSVITDIPAVGSLVAQVMGTLGTPTVLMETGGDPHHYQLRPSQAAKVQSADLLFWIGPELTPWLTNAASGLAADDSIALLAVPGTHLREYAGDGDDDDDHDHEGHDHEHEHEHEGHDHAHEGHEHDGHVHTGHDPHAWLDPANGQVWLKTIADTLSQHDPDNAATYQANAAQGAAEIAAQDSQIAAELKPVSDKRFVVFHDAYGYFTEHYGLQPAIAVSLGDASAPSAARLTEIKNQIVQEGAVCAFPEVNHDPRLLAAVTEGSKVREGAALDPSGSGQAVTAALYGQILGKIGGSLVECLGK